MAVVAISDSILTDIADAIRTKNGQETLYKPSEMPDAIEAISGGGITPTGTIEITQNGVVDVTNYASADVDVPTGGSDESKTVLLFQDIDLGDQKWQITSAIPQMFADGGYFELILDISEYTFQSESGLKIFSFGAAVNAWSPTSNATVMINVYSTGSINILFRGSINDTVSVTPNAEGVLHFKIFKNKVICLDGTSQSSTGDTEILLSGNALTIMTNISNLSRIVIGNNEGNITNYYKDPINKIAFYSV